MSKVFRKALVALSLLAASQVQAQDVVRLGNLKLAHFGAVSYIKEIAPSCGIKVEERVFPKGLDVMQAIIAGELDVGGTASEAAIQGRAGGARQKNRTCHQSHRMPSLTSSGFGNGLIGRPPVTSVIYGNWP